MGLKNENLDTKLNSVTDDDIENKLNIEEKGQILFVEQGTKKALAEDSLNNSISKSELGTANKTITLMTPKRGIAIDNQSTAVLTYKLNSDNLIRKVPAGGTRERLYVTSFTEVIITASGDYEVDFFN